MAIGLAALGLLAFLLGCSGTFAQPQNSEPAAECSLTGTWRNNLTNTIHIESVSDTGVFSGIFYTPLRYSIHIFPAALQGIQHRGLQPTFGFTISGISDGPTGVFVGQCLVDENGKEQLRTTRLYREHVESAAEDWGATRVGTDIFWRIK
ncbi:avidin-related protein 1-like [Crotalus tigris]|uniref:avidin-related protein 1-like n=1 Tax=Crotalus tigris TaxID=88082 RepID=UPI00192F9C44|nr:avidin-related protein 1-like [Crotalus tigris]